MSDRNRLARWTTWLPLLFAFVAHTMTGVSACTAQDRFMPVAEGTLDKATGLVWGYDFYQTDEYLTSIGRHVGGGTGYTWGGAYELLLNYYDENGEPLADGFGTYPEFSNWYADRTDDDWRLATRDEMVEAAQAGLIEFYDKSPQEGVQLLDPSADFTGFWSGTTERVKGRDKAYFIDLFTGQQYLVGVNSVTRALAVRGVPAPPADDAKPGHGNGKGNGKNK